jgi:hypothetical protein
MEDRSPKKIMASSYRNVIVWKKALRSYYHWWTQRSGCPIDSYREKMKWAVDILLP